MSKKTVPFFFAIFISLAIFPAGLQAAIIPVNSTIDENPMVDGDDICTLREALHNADNDGTPPDRPDCVAGDGEDIVDLTGVTGTISLVTALNGISTSMTIRGPGAADLSIEATGAFRIFITPDGGITLEISGLTLTKGAPATGGGGALFVLTTDTVLLSDCAILDNHPAPGIPGGGIKNSGDLSIENCLISGNSTTGGTGFGGGINNEGDLRIINSAITGNTAEDSDGGGIFLPSGSVVIVNSTLSGNSGRNGGGVFMTDTIPPVSTEIFSSTLTDNHATSNEGGGVGMSGGDPGNINLAIKNTILAGNTAVTEGDDCSNDDGGSGTIDSLGYNLVGDDDECSGEFAATGDQAGTSSTPLDVKLGDLAINGGSTPTHGLLAGSPALDGALAGCTDEIGGFLATDQRGFARVVGAACDIGAFEAGTCGDGGLDLGEECDDGNNSDGDGCQADCVLPICGDGILDPGENCDDGSGAPLTDCRTCGDPACGDGMINGGETCDDGNLLSGDGCSNLCLEETDSSGGCAFSAVTGKPGGVPVILILLVPIFLVFRYRGRHAAT